MVNSKSRRNLLKAIGTGIPFIGATGVVSAINNDNEFEELDLDFNPTREREVMRFLISSMEMSKRLNAKEIEDRRPSIMKKLSSKQKTAISNAWENNAKFVSYISKNTRTNVDSPSQKPQINDDVNEGTSLSNIASTQSSNYDYTIKTVVKLCYPTVLGCIWYSFDAYEFSHELHWFYTWEGVISGFATSNGKGSNYFFVKWEYDGLNDEVTPFKHPDGFYIKSWKQGKFKQILLIEPFSINSYYPSCWIQGDIWGYGSVYDIVYK